MNSEATTGLILLIIAFFMWLWNRMRGGSDFAWTGPGGPSYPNGTGGSSSPDTTETDQPWIDLDYGNDADVSAAPAAVQQWYSLAKLNAAEYNLPWQLILAQIWQESTGNPEAIGLNSDYGLMQVTPIAVQDLKENGYYVPDDWKFNPESNVFVGASFLDLCYKRSGTLADALGKTKADSLESYNEGYGGASKDYGPDEDYSVPVIQKARKLGWTG